MSGLGLAFRHLIREGSKEIASQVAKDRGEEVLSKLSEDKETTSPESEIARAYRPGGIAEQF